MHFLHVYKLLTGDDVISEFWEILSPIIKP